jgi:PAS domain S-box-containing protein
MKDRLRGRPGLSVAVRYGGTIVVILAGVQVALWLQAVLDATVVLLIAILATAWFAGFWPALAGSALATLAIDYYFTPPLYTVSLDFAHLPRLTAFTAIAALFVSISARRRQAERALKQAHDELDLKVRERTADLVVANERLQAAHAEALAAGQVLREQADLLDLTHDTIFVRDMSGVIRYWNHGAEELYGWTRDEAIGQVSHRLMRTIFPAALEVIDAELRRTGRWEGELVHVKRDGSEVVVASRWSLQRGAEGEPLAVLETNNDVTLRKRTELELEELAGRLIHAQEEERSRIGRELHDHISQMLGVLTIRLDQLRADEATPLAVATVLEGLRESTAEITDEIHGLSHRLHSSALDYLGLVPALQRLVHEFSIRHGIAIEFAHGSMPAPLPSDVALCLFRVTEESLTNIAKHSQAPSASVEVRADHDGIHLTVDDTGRGFEGDSGERRDGLGFVSMRERLRVVRGTVRIQSVPSRGTRVSAWVPAASLGRAALARSSSATAPDHQVPSKVSSA